MSIRFDLLTIDWQAISSILTFFVIVIALIPILGDKKKICIALTHFLEIEKDTEKVVKEYVQIIITNDGLRTVILTSIGFVYSKKFTLERAKRDIQINKSVLLDNVILVPKNIPKTLLPGNSITEYAYINSREIEKVDHFYVLESNRTIWKTKRKITKESLKMKCLLQLNPNKEAIKSQKKKI